MKPQQIPDVPCAVQCRGCPNYMEMPSMNLEANVKRNGLLLCVPCETRHTRRLEPSR